MTMTKKTLILSNSTDAHIPPVVAELNRLGHPWALFDPGDIPDRAQMQACIGDSVRQSSLQLANGDLIDLEDVGSVWYRRPTRTLPRDDVPGMEQTFIQREANVGVWGWLRGLPALWINHPDAVRAAGQKPEQLQRAARYGLTIPRSLVTNMPEAFKQFYEECSGQVVYKL